MMKLLIFGAGPFAQLMAGYFEADTDYSVKAFVVDAPYRKTRVQGGVPVLTPEEALNTFSPSQCALFTAIGYARMRNREMLFERAAQLGYTPASFISSTAHIAHDVEMGDNCVIFPGAVVEPHVRLGNNNILWSQVNVCHDTQVAHHNFLAAGAIIGGNCHVGHGCFFGFGSTVVHELTVADETLLGVNSVLLESSVAYGRYLGSPARLMSTHEVEGIQVR